MALFKGVAFAYVEHDQVASPGLEARLEFAERHERHRRRGFGKHLGQCLAAGHIGAQCLGDVRGHREIEALHHLDEGAAVAVLQPRVLRQFLADGRVRTALVFVRRKHFERRIKPQHAFKQTLIKCSRIAAGQVGAPRSTDEQGIAGEYTVLDAQAHGIARVTRSMQRLQPQPSDDQELTALQAQVDKWRWAGAMHHHRHTELARELLGCGEMIRVRVRVDEIPDAQTVPCGQRQVTVEQVSSQPMT